MSPELTGLLKHLLDQCQDLADRVPLPDEPPDSAAEQVTDEWCHRMIRHYPDWEEPSPEVASAMIPRIMFARLVGTRLERECLETLGETAAAADALKERLLVEAWRWKGRQMWIDRKWNWTSS